MLLIECRGEEEGHTLLIDGAKSLCQFRHYFHLILDHLTALVPIEQLLQCLLGSKEHAISRQLCCLLKILSLVFK